MLRLISRLANLTTFSFLCALIYTNLAIADPGSTTMESLKGTGSTGSYSHEEDQGKKGAIGDGVKNQKSENFERDGGVSGLTASGPAGKEGAAGAGILFFIVSIFSTLLFIKVLLRDLFREDPLIKQKKSKEDLKKYGLWLIHLKNRMEELFPDKNLDEVNSMEAEFLKKHSMLCEQVDLAHTQPVIDISPQK